MYKAKKKITYLEEKDQMFLQFVFNKYLLLKHYCSRLLFYIIDYFFIYLNKRNFFFLPFYNITLLCNNINLFKCYFFSY